ncbi:MAG: Fic family protein [Nanoarchaeota archaeon]
MAAIKKRTVGGKKYFYVEHNFKIGKKTKTLSKYLGKKIPDNIEEIKEDMEYKHLKLITFSKIKEIKSKYDKEQNNLPAEEKQKLIEDFLVHFIYNSSKIEGSSLSLDDTKGLFLHNTTPKNKPLNEVRETEGYRKAFYSMMEFKGKLSLSIVNKWHEMIFRESKDYIAGKLRIHKIIVTGSRTSFPAPEDVPKLLAEFFGWYSKNEKRMNPVELAALSHLKFVTIHPYSDGNGRISRLLANYVLIRHEYPMLNIKFKDRMEYYKNLEASQINEKQKYFVRFFMKRYIK